MADKAPPTPLLPRLPRATAPQAQRGTRDLSAPTQLGRRGVRERSSRSSGGGAHCPLIVGV